MFFFGKRIQWTWLDVKESLYLVRNWAENDEVSSKQRTTVSDKEEDTELEHKYHSQYKWKRRNVFFWWCHSFCQCHWTQVTMWVKNSFFVVYYEKIKWEVNKRLIYECLCDERLKPEVQRSTRLTYTVFLQVYILKISKIKKKIIQKIRGDVPHPLDTHP